MPAIDDLIQSFIRSLPDRVVDATNLWSEYEQGKRPDLAALKRLLHTVKGEAHMLSLDVIGDHLELVEDVVVLVHQKNQTTERTADTLLEALDILALVGPEGDPQEMERIGRSLREVREALRSLPAAPDAASPTSQQTEPQWTENTRGNHAKLTEVEPHPEDVADAVDPERRAENTMRVEDVQPTVHELRRLYEEQLLLQPRLRELQRILRAIVAEMDPSLPPAVLGEQVVKTLGAAADLERRLSTVRTEWSANSFATGLALDQLGETTQRAAMVGIHRLRGGLERVARQTARALGKEVNLRVEGDAFLDAAIAQRLETALLHAVRNSIDHGIESPEERLLAGKPPKGNIEIRVLQQLSAVEVAVSDDGRGVNTEEVRKRYSLSADLSERSVLRFLLQGGISTRDVATSISGRGVGLDVVARETTEVGGTVELESQLGKGFRIVLTLPTLLRADLIVPVECGAHRLALPARNVEAFVRIQDLEQTTEGACARVKHDDRTELLPVHALESLFGEGGIVEVGRRALLLSHGGTRFLLTVDGHGNPRPLPFQPASELAFRSPLVAAVAPSPQGLRVLLDVAAVVQALHGTKVHAVAKDHRRVAKVVVVEDAPVARELLCGILRSFGLQVTEASHGAEGLLRIREIKHDMVLTDVEMPFVGGLEMVHELRKEKRFEDLPVIVLTTDTREVTRARADALHVAGFLSKQKFIESELRQLVDRCLEGRL